MQLIFIEDSMYLPSRYFENEIVFDCVKLLENVIFQRLFFLFFFLWQKDSDMGINYYYALEAGSSFSSFLKIKA